MPLKNIIITWYNPYKNEGRWNAMEFNGIGIGISDFKALRIRNIFDYESALRIPLDIYSRNQKQNLT